MTLPPPEAEPEAVREHWIATVEQAPWIRAADGGLLLAYARCLADLDEAREQVRENGVLVATRSGSVVESPWTLREGRLRGQLVTLAKALGLGS